MLIIFLKSSAIKEAPPINKPSMCDFSRKDLALSALLLPPYKTLDILNLIFMNMATRSACSGSAALPVPIAQTGS